MASDASLLPDLGHAVYTLRAGLMAARAMVVRRRGANCRLWSACCAERADAVELDAQPVFLDFQVIAGLQVQPEPLGGAEVPGQPQRGVRSDAPLAVDDLVDPAGRDIDRLGQLILAHAQRREEVPHAA